MPGGVVDADELAFVTDDRMIDDGVEYGIVGQIVGGESGAVLADFGHGDAGDFNAVFTAARAEA